MLGDVLVTGEGVRVEMPYASLPSRLLAAALDLLIGFFAVYLSVLLLVTTLNGRIDEALLRAIVVTLIVGGFLGYPVIMTALTGRTLGKMALGLRVVRDDGGPIGFREAFTRELAGLVIEKPGALLGFPALVTSVTRDDAKRIGDLLAGTVVLSERVPVVPQQRAPVPPPVAEWAQGLDLSRLSDSLAQRGRTIADRAASLSLEARERLAGPVLLELEAVVGPRPSTLAPPVWLSAILGERRRREELRLSRPVAEAFGVAAWDR